MSETSTRPTPCLDEWGADFSVECCGTCNKPDNCVAVAVFESNGSRITLCSNCLVDLANAVEGL